MKNQAHQNTPRFRRILSLSWLLACVFLVPFALSAQSLDGTSLVCANTPTMYYFTPPGGSYILYSASWSTSQGSYSNFSPSGNELSVTWTSGPGTVVIDYTYYEPDVPGVYHNGSLNYTTTVTTPTLYTVGGGGSYCSGSTGPTVTLSGSESGAWYQLKVNGVDSGSPINGYGSALSWTNRTTAGTYTVVATISGGCTSTMNGSASVSINPLPTQFTVSGGGAYCAGSTGPTVTLSSSTSGVNYQLKINGSNSGSPIAGTGSALNWINQTTGGSYTVVATNVSTSCTQTMSGSATVTQNSLPATYTVSGGGTICSGATGPTVTLSGSQTGVNYQLKINGTNSGSAVAGTGAALNWTNQTTAGNYTVVATNATTGCVQTMVSSATVTVNPLPTLYTVGGGGGYCSGGTGPNVTLSGSQTGINYQLKINGTNSGSAVAGTGSALTWANQTTAGTYTVVATNASTACTQNMTGSVAVSINPLPTLFTVSGGGTICSGATGVTITLSGSTSGVNYQLKVNGTNTGSAVAGTGAALNWTNQATAGSYTVVATNATTSCTQTMSGSAAVTVNLLPALFTVSGGGTICSGAAGVTVTLSGSASGVNYQLKINGTNSGSAVAGTGAALNWTNQTTAGSYTVVATIAATGCSQTMTGSATVTVNPLPTLFAVGGGGGYCSPSTVSVTLSGSTSGLNYQLKLNGSNTGSPVAGTGSALSWNGITAAGTYTIQATDVSTTCTQAMTGSTLVTVNSLPTLFTVSGGGAMCTGASGLTINLSGSTSGVSYQLKVGGVNSGSPLGGTGSALSWTNKTTAGSYTVEATGPGAGCVRTMTGSATITVNPLPTLHTVSGGGTICPGATGPTITLSSSTSGVSYQLKLGGTNVQTAKNGTGSALNWTNVGGAGTYTIVGTITATTCQATMTGTATVTHLATAPLYTVSAVGPGPYCGVTPGVTVQLSNSQVGVNYQLKRGGTTNVGSPVAGTGSALTWTGNVITSTYTVQGTLVSTGCMQIMTGSVVVNPVPVLYGVSGTATICFGSAGTPITLSNSQTGFNYQLQIDGVNTGSPIAGTNGVSLAWPNQTAPGQYRVYGTNATTGCGRLMTAAAVITVSTPALQTISGGGTTCAGGTNFTLSQTSSVSGTNYQLRKDGVNTGSPKPGTGSALSWTGLNDPGAYTVMATIVSTGCTRLMTGTVNISHLAVPTISGPSTIGTSAITLTSSTLSGASYQWKRDGTNIQNATSSTLNTSQSGDYQVIISVNGCNQTSAIHSVSSNALPYYNGIIAAVRWRTDKPYQVSGSDLKGMFTYRYDEKYQLKESQFSVPDFGLNTFVFAGNQFRVGDLRYDPNGNIKTLKRFGELGTIQHNFAYQYNGTVGALQTNKLEAIPGYASYQYNEIGQLTEEVKDGAEPDQYVNYNVTGKVTEVYSDPSRQSQFLKVVYTYDDRGFRLAKTNIPDSITTWYIRDAGGNIVSIYETSHTTGTTTQKEIPIYGSGKLGTYYPVPNEQDSVAYELTDHLGNVRALVKEKTTEYVATMEDNGEPDLGNPRVQELQYFDRVFETEHDNQWMNHSAPSPGEPNPSMASYLYFNDNPGTQASDKAIGPSITLQVIAGDRLTIETFARYERQISYNRNVDLLLLSSLLGNTFLGNHGVDNLSTLTNYFQNGLGAGPFFADTDTDRPFAFLNYMLLNESFEFVDGGVWRVGEDGAFDPGGEVFMNFDHVKFPEPIVAIENGYIYVWVANESKTTKVWFDDLKVTHTVGAVTQATDYGAWGDVIKDVKSAGEDEYRFGYQGQFAEKDPETGWSHFQLREFDPVIGRWKVVDPKRYGSSPYIGMDNDPCNKIDVDGGCPGGCPPNLGLAGMFTSLRGSVRSNGPVYWKASVGAGAGFRSYTMQSDGTGFDAGIDGVHGLIYWGNREIGYQGSVLVATANRSYRGDYHGGEFALYRGYLEYSFQDGLNGDQRFGQYRVRLGEYKSQTNNLIDKTPSNNFDFIEFEGGFETNFFDLIFDTFKNMFRPLVERVAPESEDDGN